MVSTISNEITNSMINGLSNDQLESLHNRAASLCHARKTFTTEAELIANREEYEAMQRRDFCIFAGEVKSTKRITIRGAKPKSDNPLRISVHGFEVPMLTAGLDEQERIAKEKAQGEERFRLELEAERAKIAERQKKKAQAAELERMKRINKWEELEESRAGSDQFKITLIASSFKGTEACHLARLEKNDDGQVIDKIQIAPDFSNKQKHTARTWTETNTYSIGLADGDWIEILEAGSARNDSHDVVQYVGGKFVSKDGREVETDFKKL